MDYQNNRDPWRAPDVYFEPGRTSARELFRVKTVYYFPKKAPS